MMSSLTKSPMVNEQNIRIAILTMAKHDIVPGIEQLNNLLRRDVNFGAVDKPKRKIITSTGPYAAFDFHVLQTHPGTFIFFALQSCSWNVALHGTRPIATCAIAL